MSEGHWWSDTD